MDIQQSVDGRIRELSLFAGAGGGILAGQLLGWRTVCAVERDAYAAAILAQRQNDRCLEPFPIWSDVTTFDHRPWAGRVDVVSGGFPCQAFSKAARGRNKPEKNLWGYMRNIILGVQPPIVFGENVSRKAIDQAERDLSEIGYKCQIIKLSASDLGADHIRNRFWIFAYTDNKRELLRKIHDEMANREKLQNSVWKSIPSERGMVDGLANRMDRIKATGNGQIPIVAATAFRIMVQTTMSL